MYDDDGNELLNYRTAIYHRDVLRQFVKEAEATLGSLLYDKRNFRGNAFPDKSEGVTFEGLTEDQVTTLDHMERCIHNKSIEAPKDLRW